MKEEIKYDSKGRMKYHPEFHFKQYTPWSIQDQNYLIENYIIDGSKKISLSLGRTQYTVDARVCELRKSGVMPKRNNSLNTELKHKYQQ